MVTDSKDWTWVLQRPCPECGFEAEEVAPAELPELVRRTAGSWRHVLAGSDVAARPSADVWSPLEYACHVRDVFRIFDGRLAQMLAEDDPLFLNWDQDETAVVERYDEQDPATVATELTEAAERIAASFAAVGAEQWSRRGRRSDGASFTVASLGRYFIHDPIHHLTDVGGA